MTTLTKINGVITLAGGEIFVVGGTVRDAILGVSPKDVDFLVRKLSLDAISKAVSQIGKAGEVGASFGIVKAVIDGQEFDFAIPRTKETKTGDKHTDFSVDVDPFASVESDLSRRDFTCNSCCVALGDYINFVNHNQPLTNVIDPFGGALDIANKIIRTVGKPEDRFNEDPLRILRGLGFAARFGFIIEAKTVEAIIKLAPVLHPSQGRVTSERIFEEFKKVWSKALRDLKPFIDNLKDFRIGEVLFGKDFAPIASCGCDATGPSDLKINLCFVAFFLKGGNFEILKPDNYNLELLKVAKGLYTNAYPHTFIKSEFLGLTTLGIFFNQHDRAIFAKLTKLFGTPRSAKQLALDGNEIAQVLGITEKKDLKKIGIAQKMLLEAFWNETNGLVNTKESIDDYLKTI